ncbi:13902_t:CDS:2, partial [Cetraspora pellucida]
EIMHNKSETQEVQLKEDLDISSSLTKEIEDEDSFEEQDEFIISKQLQAQNRKKKKSGGFQSMGLSYPIYKAILHKGFKVPTPIQRKTIPLIMDGKDVVGMARTGSGKTAAFLIPIIEKLKVHSAKVGARAIILSPSRELALQTQKVCKELTKYTDLRTCLLVGGDSLEEQFAMFANNPDIILATPGRFLHLIVEMELELKTVEFVVFDEADRLFELGFSAQLHEILHRLPQSRQTMLFSATLPKSLVEFANAGLQDPSLVRLDTDTKISTDVMRAFFSVKQLEKEAALLYLLYEVIKIHLTPTSSVTISKNSNNKDDNSSNTISQSLLSNQTIIFVSTKHHVEYITNLLNLSGFQTSYIYGSLDQTARKIQINNFRGGRTNILVVTDVAARGIDIPILENVINYDFIDSSKMFVHRVGRTARAGRKGCAYSLITPEE